ncbi:MBL fold metallo-hydrolase [Clostridium beijerinckii]|uniref:MBL fold metallo-hydrolase n=3 Tax=Clostridium beijerinckii TaxID=1520 RepID=A0AB74VM76_CLOBE|nr:MBL fold metallo-hydrolase [Clostridium beijerinckii]ALB46509.1 MBL fold metallo-hydrolase [Clostridium beijerinckii NRRL B-598]MBC2460272.1 MBL fold metallo-hydrolase [Clostridium beijerinckii]MBC2477775.1 MBL fold metallo-hydrolase [Clostridium beijerinckii]NOV59826.1 metallo-beta-lactamase class B [Clostridium beijerinckii]NOV71390.1 metallo-beta-lactamase class B [Clostridium beijerinckii]
MNRLNKPIITKETIKAMEDMSFFTHAMIFDDLLIVAQKETNCFVLKTSDGLIVIDAIWPAKEAFDAIVSAIKDVGWDPDTIKKLVLTHGHVDHTGCGKWFVEKYHAYTYLSKIDDIFWEEHPTKPDRPETWKDYKIDVYVQDGDTIILGDKTIYVYGTPGHTPGGLSYIFPVKDDGKIHMAALWGATTPPWTKNEVKQYLKSLDYFISEAISKKVDVALSNHTAIDNGLERIIYSKARMDYMPNIYIVGQDGFQNYCQVFRTLSYDLLERL